jgi:hypothetical protein
LSLRWRDPIWALIALASLLTACARAGEAGVTVKGFDDDLVFGVKEAEAAPPNTLGDTAVDEADLGDTDLPSQVFDKSTKRSAPPLTRPKIECDEADAGDVVKEPAPLTVPSDRRPKVGSYRWKRAGTVQSESTGNIKFPIAGFEQRVIRDVKELGPSTNSKSLGVPGAASEPGVVFTYETVQPDINGNVVVSLFKVDTSPLGAYADSPAGGEEVRAGGPERGVVLKSFTVLDRKGNELSTFSPTTGLLLLPLPARAGEDFTASAVDTKTGASMSYQAKVTNRQLVDVCGELIEAWHVKGTQTFSGEETVSRNYEITVSTAHGGIPVAEQTDQTTGGELHLTTTLGQLEPDPLPSS